MNDPIIFLDVDGVLNHRGVFVRGGGADPLCPLAVERFIALVKSTEAKVVLSSTWRLGGRQTKHYRKLRNAGVLDTIHEDWRTVDLPCHVENGIIIDGVEGARRGREIAEWLSRHPEYDNFAIIDDDSDMLPEQMPRFVQTSFDTGLLDWHCEEVRAVLSSRSAKGRS